MTLKAESLRQLGGALRERRKADGLSLQDVSATLKIRAVYLEAIEDGNRGALPPPFYVTNYVRAYAEHLGLDGVGYAQAFNALLHPIRGRERPQLVAARSLETPHMAFLASIVGLVALGWALAPSPAPPIQPPAPPRPTLQAEARPDPYPFECREAMAFHSSLICRPKRMNGMAKPRENPYLRQPWTSTQPAE